MLPEEDCVKATGNTRTAQVSYGRGKELDEDGTFGCWDMCIDRKTDRHAHHTILDSPTEASNRTAQQKRKAERLTGQPRDCQWTGSDHAAQDQPGCYRRAGCNHSQHLTYASIHSPAQLQRASHRHTHTHGHRHTQWHRYDRHIQQLCARWDSASLHSWQSGRPNSVRCLGSNSRNN